MYCRLLHFSSLRLMEAAMHCSPLHCTTRTHTRETTDAGYYILHSITLPERTSDNPLTDAAPYCGIIHYHDVPQMIKRRRLLCYAVCYAYRLYLQWSTGGGYYITLPKPTSDAPLSEAIMYHRWLHISEIPPMIRWQRLHCIATS